MSELIRVAHTSYPSEGRFHLLRDLPFVTYEENLPGENARKLHEGEVDVALISSSQFAIHGGYLGLDFGVLCRGRGDFIRLFAHEPVNQLSTIYVHDNSSSSVLLLRTLLRSRWHASPRLVRAGVNLDYENLSANEAVLVRRDQFDACREVFPLEIDLVSEYDTLTGRPYIFLVWATRPGVLSLEQLQEFNAVFHKIARLENDPAEASSIESPDRPAPSVTFYFDAAVRQHLNFQFQEAHRLHLLPDQHYQFNTYTLLDKKPKGRIIRRPLYRILEHAVEGKRLSITDGVRLAREASLADLGLAADQVRRSVLAERSVGFIYVASGNCEELRRHVEQATAFGSERVLLLPAWQALGSLEEFENLLISIKRRMRVEIEGFGVPHLLRMAEIHNLPVQEVVSRLVTAGLDAVPPFGGGMLIDSIMKEKGYQRFTATDWLSTIRWVHRCGARSAGSLVVSPNESWEERLIHLEKLRTLQDEIPGFRHVICQLSPDWAECPDIELKLRATSVARLFLDNVAAVLETEMTTDPVRALLSLCFGGSQIRLQVGELHRRSVQDAVQMLQELAGAGFDLRKDSFRNISPQRPNPPLH